MAIYWWAFILILNILIFKFEKLYIYNIINKFISFFAEYYTKKIDKNQIINGLSFLDKNKNGLINANELRHALQKIGEKLTDEESYDLLKNYTDKYGMINYKKFTEEISK